MIPLIIIAIVLVIGIIVVDMAYPKDPHVWEYRNPSNRTCKICGQHEQEQCWAWDYERRGLAAGGWWEVCREGDMKKHEKKI